MNGIHILLVQPKIPSNTGNIIRLCANTGSRLHLVQPLGFDLDDKKLRRAGLDYHEYAQLTLHPDWQHARLALQHCKMVALTTKLSQPFYQFDFPPDPTQEIALVFGSEDAGLPETIRQDIGSQNWLRLPMLPNSRSLNLSNSVAICLYEVWRQKNFIGDRGQSIGYHSPNSNPQN